MTDLDAILHRLAATPPLVVVAGDAVLDRWVTGESRRLSREAPAPVVDVHTRSEVAGGAANTAVNLAALGANVRFVGAVGEDPPGAAVRELMARAGIEVGGLRSSPELTTTTKTRIVADDQVLVRIDELAPMPSDRLRRILEDALGAALIVALDGAVALLVSDYGSTLLHDAVSRAIGARRPPLVVVDAHDPAAWRDVRPDVVVPNADEAARLVGALHPGSSPGSRATRASAAAASASRLLEEAGAAAAVVTLDRDGVVVLRPGAEPMTTTAHPVAERFASGAGDTFAAALTAALATGASLEDSARLAQKAADVALRGLGASVCTAEELAAAVAAAPALLSPGALAAAVERDRHDGLRIVFTNGCFDVLHLGHTTYLREARELGDRLIVAVNADESARRLKGPGRPVNGEVDRAAVLAALECVDYVTVFDGDTPIPLIEALRPDIYVKGGDYTADMLEESPVVESYGGEVRIVGYVAEHSTTAVVDRIRTPAEDPG